MANNTVAGAIWWRMSADLRYQFEVDGFGPPEIDPACTGHISSQPLDDLPGVEGENLTIYRGYVSIRPAYTDPSPLSKPPSPMTPRGTITGFSSGSRRRMIQRIASLESLPELWLDLTFPDEAFPESSDYRSIATYTYDRLRTFAQSICRRYPECWLYWRREWVPRRSGSAVGALRPHFHVLCRGLPAGAVPSVMSAWVDALALAPAVRSKALAVALSPESWRRIENHKMAACYASKYLAKIDKYDIPESDSLGRMWGTFGPVPVGAPVVLRVSVAVAIQLRRAFSRKARRSLKHCRAFKKKLKSFGTSLFVLIERETVHRLLEWAEDCPSGVPF
jgi:hypothetical protein